MDLQVFSFDRSESLACARHSSESHHPKSAFRTEFEPRIRNKFNLNATPNLFPIISEFYRLKLLAGHQSSVWPYKP